MRSRSWVRFALAAMALLLAASWGVSGALRYGWARRFLLAQLSASFGRPVDASRFTFSLLSGPRLEAESVTVAEDPRFGQEYFLRADQLAVSLRWWALLRGRVEFGTLSFTSPTLNLVHASTGHWNVESWLPPLKQPLSSPASLGQAVTDAPPARAAKHLGRIELDGGRINFKLGSEKLLFALVGLSGHLDQDGAGRWSLDLEANPMRASVALQDAGMLRLRGTVAGTSARLRPATLVLTWEEASLADALRLASGRDYGARGMLGAELTARIEDVPAGFKSTGTTDGWKIAGRLRLAGIHRWDLPARGTDPAVNLAMTAAWSPGTPHMVIESCVLEAAHSQMHATGEVDWSHGFNPSVQIVSSQIGLGDLLSWPRSFRPGIANDLAMDGSIALQGRLAGWPSRIEQASVASDGVVVHLGSLGGPIRVGPISAGLQRNLLVVKPVAVSLPGSAGVAAARSRPPNGAAETPAPAGMLRVEGALGPFLPKSGPRDWPYRLALSGQTTRTQDLLALLQSFGRPASKDWKVEGPASLQLVWMGAARSPIPAPNGTLQLNGLRLTSAVLNQPVLLSNATIEVRPGGRRVKLAGAEAFGADWKGTLDWEAGEEIWHFDLSADRLDMADLDRWLGPRSRAGLLERMLPFAASPDSPPDRDAAIERLAARGRLRVGEVSLAPLRGEKLEAGVELRGRNLVLRHVQAGFFDGRVAGDFEAMLSAKPAYTFRGQFDRVNLATLTPSEAWPEGRFTGLASGDVEVVARGIGRENLLESLAARGDLRVREPVVRGLDLASTASGAAEPLATNEGRFVSATAGFHIAGSRIHVDQLYLATRDERFEIQGSVDFARQLDLRIWPLPRGVDAALDSGSDPEREEWGIGGTLDAPLMTRQTHIAGNGAAAPVPAPGAQSGRRWSGKRTKN